MDLLCSGLKLGFSAVWTPTIPFNILYNHVTSHIRGSYVSQGVDGSAQCVCLEALCTNCIRAGPRTAEKRPQSVNTEQSRTYTTQDLLETVHVRSPGVLPSSFPLHISWSGTIKGLSLPMHMVTNNKSWLHLDVTLDIAPHASLRT